MADPTMATEEGQGEKPMMLRAVSVSEPGSKTPFELPEDLIKNTELEMDPYNENETALRFLHSKPTCFIVIGKPGAGKTSLVRRLAAEWKCELINPTEIILRAIEMETESGKKCAEILNRGEAVSEDMVIKMIEEKVNSPEVAHHGKNWFHYKIHVT
ncbi:Hypothetical predicted protein [Mytilus galloprovincialis]|uniref:Uncharacterized protein n=1 Tax=Mytilus galloprovincialis TaxID=29158 RepID=A0A8B6EYP9_MYTGA|nr:Hypothetical predicted protein [Mytilus galloprovincialis]